MTTKQSAQNTSQINRTHIPTGTHSALAGGLEGKRGEDGWGRNGGRWELGKVDIRLSGKGNSNSHGAGPVY